MTIPSIISTIILGSFSDLYDRKWPLVSPVIGAILYCIIQIILATSDSAPVAMVVVANFLDGFFGGTFSMMMGVSSYIAAVSDVKSRSMRVALVEAMSFLGGTIGPFIAGGIFTSSGSHAAVFFFVLS